MPWVRFTSDFNWKPKASVTIVYKAGQKKNVPTACAAAAVVKEHAVRLKKASKDAAPVDAIQSED